MPEGQNSSTDNFIFEPGVTRNASRRSRHWMLWPLGLSAVFVAGCFAYAAWQIRTQQVELIDLRMEANRLRTMRDYSGDYAETLKDRNALREQLVSLQGEKSATAQASNSREAELQRLIKFMQEELAAKNSLIEDLKNGKAVALPVEQPQPGQP